MKDGCEAWGKVEVKRSQSQGSEIVKHSTLKLNGGEEEVKLRNNMNTLCKTSEIRKKE